jgi:hypothetical protein
MFGALTSQVPGTLAIGSETPGEILYHCLDRHGDTVQTLAADESLFVAGSGGRPAAKKARRD